MQIILFAHIEGIFWSHMLYSCRTYAHKPKIKFPSLPTNLHHINVSHLSDAVWQVGIFRVTDICKCGACPYFFFYPNMQQTSKVNHIYMYKSVKTGCVLQNSSFTLPPIAPQLLCGVRLPFGEFCFVWRKNTNSTLVLAVFPSKLRQSFGTSQPITTFGAPPVQSNPNITNTGIRKFAI